MKYKNKDNNYNFVERLHRTLLTDAPFWQGMGFVLLICMIWAIRVFDVTGYFFAPPEDQRPWYELSLMTLLIIVMGFVVIANTYAQQRRVLKKIIKVCSYCNKAKIEDSDWTPLENYISENSLSDFSHGICPDCYRKLIEEIEEQPHYSGNKTSDESETDEDE